MIYTYQVLNSGFTSVVTEVNNLILQRELSDVGLSDISLFFNDGYVQFSSLLDIDSSKESLIDSICSAHVGGEFSEQSQSALGTLVSSTSPLYEDALDLDCGLMIGGKYLLNWYGEAKINLEGDNSVSLVRLLQIKNGITTLIAESCGISEFPMKVGGVLIINLANGDNVQFKMQISRGEKTGTSATTSIASIDRTKLFIKPY
jgi:hypothetical protein